MTNFNTSNELAAVLVDGRTYQGDEPCFPITKIIFHHDNGLDEEDRIVVTNDGSDWTTVASRIHALLGQGYDYTTLPCPYCGATDMDDVLCCDECGEAIPHGHEHPGIDEDGDGVTYCDGCHESENDITGKDLEAL